MGKSCLAYKSIVGVRGLALVGPEIPPYAPEFYDGFASGDFTKWTAYASALIITSPVHHGTYAARSTNDVTNHLDHQIASGYGTYYTRFYAYFENFITGPGSRILWEIRTLNNFIAGLYMEVGAGSSSWRLALDCYYGSYVVGSTVLTTGWHCIEILVNKGTGGVMRVWLDGTLEIDTTANNPNADMWKFFLDLYYTTNPRFILDCVIGDGARPTCSYYSHLDV